MRKNLTIIVLMGGAVFLQNSRLNAKTADVPPLPCPDLTAHDVIEFVGQNTLTQNGIEWVLVPHQLEPKPRTQNLDSDGTCSYEDANGVLRFKLAPQT